MTGDSFKAFRPFCGDGLPTPPQRPWRGRDLDQGAPLARTVRMPLPDATAISQAHT